MRTIYIVSSRLVKSTALHSTKKTSRFTAPAVTVSRFQLRLGFEAGNRQNNQVHATNLAVNRYGWRIQVYTTLNKVYTVDYLYQVHTSWSSSRQRKVKSFGQKHAK